MQAMRAMTATQLLPGLLALALASGCGEDDDDDSKPDPGGSGERPLQCDADSYVAFDTSNYQNQILRLGAHADIVAKIGVAIDADPFDASAVQAAFADGRALYHDTASLQEKVQGRVDDHLDDAPAVGTELDLRLERWFDAGEAAQDALGASVAKQWIDKTLIDFFFLSVFHELTQGDRATWDEGFGYFGAPVDNAEGERRGLAAVATKRDAGNGTALEAEVYNALLDGSCALAEALLDSSAESVDWRGDPALERAVEEVDEALRKTLAYSAGHEAFEMAEVREALEQDPADAEAQDEMWIKLAELDPYFQPLERLMTAAGGESATRAAEIRAALDAAWDGWETRDGSWMVAFDAVGVVERLEAEFGIDVKS